MRAYWKDKSARKLRRAQLAQTHQMLAEKVSQMRANGRQWREICAATGKCKFRKF
jgi:hypothetical protein